MIYENSNYKTVKGNQCLLACLHNYLNYYNFNHSESTIFFSNENNIPIFSRQDSDEPYGKLEIDFFSIIEDYAQNAGFLLKSEHSFDYSNSVNRLLYCVDNEISVTIGVNASKLKYHKIFARGNNALHFVNVIGHSMRDNKLYISDGFIPVNPTEFYQGWVNIDEILPAWQAKKYYMIIFELNPSCLKLNRINYDRILLQLNKHLVKYLTGGREGDIIYGIDALIYYKENIVNIFKDSRSDSREIFIKFNMQLRNWGFFTCKKMIMEILNNQNELKNYGEKIREINKKWEYVSKLLIKMAFSNRRVDLEQFEAAMNETISLEITVYEQLSLFLAGRT